MLICGERYHSCCLEAGLCMLLLPEAAHLAHRAHLIAADMIR